MKSQLWQYQSLISATKNIYIAQNLVNDNKEYNEPTHKKLNNTTPIGLYNGHNRRRTTHTHTPETRTLENKG